MKLYIGIVVVAFLLGLLAGQVWEQDKILTELKAVVPDEKGPYIRMDKPDERIVLTLEQLGNIELLKPILDKYPYVEGYGQILYCWNTMP